MEEETKKRLTLGKFLQRVREQNGLTLEYVANQLKLKVSTVRELEDDCYVNIGSLVYIKGYLRSYARLLHVNIDEQLQSNPSSTEGAGGLSDLISQKPKRLDLAKFNFSSTVWIIFILVIISSLGYYHHQKRIHREENKPLINTPIVPAPAKEPPPVLIPVKVDSATVNNANDNLNHAIASAKLTQDNNPSTSNTNNSSE